jgi:CubicO group peptidase (beta-lactamase class C family)
MTAVAVLFALVLPGSARADEGFRYVRERLRLEAARDQSAGRLDKIDRYVRDQMLRQRIPGLSLVIVKDGKITKQKGYGLANIEHRVPAKPETVYQAGSVGKQFTAAAVMLLVEEGKLSLDAPISDYLDDTPAAWKDVTVRHLLTHTSGIKDYSAGLKGAIRKFSSEPRDVDLREDLTESALLKKFAAFKMDFAPGTNWSYSNTGYVLLGMLIREVSGEHHGTFLHKRILKPLGLRSTRVINEADIVPNRAAGYRLLKRCIKNQEWVAPSLNTLADGCLYTTVLDLAKWDAALFAGKVLKKASLDETWTPVEAGGKTHPYGFGWRLEEVGRHKVRDHRGGWQGFGSYLAHYPDHKVTVIALTNLSSASPERIGREVAGLCKRELTPPRPRRLVEPEPRVAALLRTVLKKLADGTLKPRLFTAEAKKDFFPDSAESWHETLSNVGPLQSLVLVQRKLEKDTRVCRYLADFGEIGLRIDLTLTKENKISGLTLYQY